MAGTGRYDATNPLDKYMTQAKNPLQQAIDLFKPGGGFGAWQNALIEEEAKRNKAQALSDQVASGMSSGSLATSTGLRIGRDTTTAKLGVEDTRTQFLNQALQALSGLFGQFGGLNSQRELGLKGLAVQKQGNQMDALSRVAAANAGTPDPSRSFFTPSTTKDYNPWGPTTTQTDNQGYNIPQY
jgi:hypothetical protein